MCLPELAPEQAQQVTLALLCLRMNAKAYVRENLEQGVRKLPMTRRKLGAPISASAVRQKGGKKRAAPADSNRRRPYYALR